MSGRPGIEEAARRFEEARRAQSLGRLEEAAELYRRSIALHPTAEAHTFLGWAYAGLGRHEEAIRECRRAIALDPDFGNPYNDIGAYLVELGRFDEAVPWLRRATRARRYEPRHFPHYNLARVHLHRYELAEARRCLLRALHLEPSYAAARHELRRLEALLN